MSFFFQSLSVFFNPSKSQTHIDLQFDDLGLALGGGEARLDEVGAGVFEGDGRAGNSLIIIVPGNRRTRLADAFGLIELQCQRLTNMIGAISGIVDGIIVHFGRIVKDYVDQQIPIR